MWRATQFVRGTWRRRWDVALAAGVALSALALPPRVAFVPHPALALAVVALGGVALLWPARGRVRIVAHGLGAALLWGVVAWCALTQPAPLTRPVAFFWSLRALPLAILAAVWLLMRLPRRWQRGAVVALALPTVSGLGLVAWASPPQPPDFMPYYVAVDSRGVVYASDEQAPVIRVFGPDGALRAKIRPGLASLRDTPSAGLYPPGPYNDPDQLGVPRTAAGMGTVSGQLQPWAAGTDDFWFCGLAVGDEDRLYVVDWMRGRLLRFAPDGRLELRVPLPASYRPSLGCVTAGGGGHVYLGDESGAILALDDAGHVTGRFALPEAIVGGVNLAPDGRTLYALARERVYAVATASGRVTSWPLPAPSGTLGQPYQAILALGDSVLIANLQARRMDVYTLTGAALPAIGSAGAMPGQFGQVGGLARDAGQVYAADVDHRVLQRFDATGAVNALIWSPDDDEID